VLLSNNRFREFLGEAGHARCIANKTMNEDVMNRVMEAVFGIEETRYCRAAGGAIVV
jgi:hypothetical protein